MCGAGLADKQLAATLRPEDFRDPIGFIYEEHERIGRYCERLVRLAGDLTAEGTPEVAAPLLDFIENLLPMHIADEEDLFPLLKLRLTDRLYSSTDFKIVSVMQHLVIEHRDDIDHGRALVEPLRLIAAGRLPAEPEMFGHLARTFATLQQRHRDLENTVVLPLAIELLMTEDKTELSRKFAARRSISIPS